MILKHFYVKIYNILKLYLYLCNILGIHPSLYMNDNNNIHNIEYSFLSFYNDYSDQIFRFCFIKTSNRDVALDLTQETFTKMWEYIAEKKEEIREPKSLLYRIATNLVIDYYRKKKSESLEALIEYGFNPEETMSISLEKELEIKELHLKLYKLEDKYKDILIMRFVEDMSLEEIAKVYDQHANTIAVRIHRAIEKLKTLY